jgi:hypothetical protein
MSRNRFINFQNNIMMNKKTIYLCFGFEKARSLQKNEKHEEHPKQT